MTPKEKAEELVKKMYKVHSNSASQITLYFAKQCALIAVDEVLKIMRNEYFDESEAVQYWVKVKQEIEKQ